MFQRENKIENFRQLTAYLLFPSEQVNLGIVAVKLLNEDVGLSLLVQSNPVTTNNLSLNLFSSEEDKVVLKITDLQGRTIHQEKYTLNKNESKFISLDLSRISKGTYFITATTRNSSVNRKFLFLNRE